MRKLAVLALVVAVAAMFTLPALAADSDAAKPCAPCPKPCVQCGQPCNLLQSTADAINCIKAPDLCPKCAASPKPCPKPCNTCNK